MGRTHVVHKRAGAWGENHGDEAEVREKQKEIKNRESEREVSVWAIIMLGCTLRSTVGPIRYS